MLPKIDHSEQFQPQVTEDRQGMWNRIGKSIQENTFGKRFLNPEGVAKKTARVIKDAGVMGTLSALRSKADLNNAEGDIEQRSRSAGRASRDQETTQEIKKLQTPLKGIQESMNKLNGNVEAMRQAPRQSQDQFTKDGRKKVRPEEVLDAAPGSMAETIQRMRMNSSRARPVPNQEQSQRHASPVEQPKKSSMFDWWGSKKQASSDGESATSTYRQNERQSTAPKEFIVSKFDNEAVEQLGDVFEKALKKIDFNQSGAGGMGAGLLGGLSGLLGGKTRGTGRLPPRDAKGRFVSAKAAGGRLVNNVAAGAKNAGSMMKAPAFASKAVSGVARGAAKALPFLGRAAGVAAVPITAAISLKNRSDEGQTDKQKFIGTGGEVVGGLAGGIAGAKAGAVVGGGLGALAGGVGAAPGAVIGGVVGGVGGAIAGSSAGGWIADKFTGVKNRILPKENSPTPQSKDLISLQKTKDDLRSKSEKKDQERKQAPIVISAPQQTTVVQQRNQSMISSGGSSQGSRGSLDLKKFT